MSAEVVGHGVGAWYPRSFAQDAALRCPAWLVKYGGSAGSLKTETLLIAAALQRDNPAHRAIVFRNSYKEVVKHLERRSSEIYPSLGGRYNKQERVWRFPSGAVVEFGALETEEQIKKFQGIPHNFIGFDESTNFQMNVIRGLVAWARSSDPALQETIRIFLATNPGGISGADHRSVFQGPHCICDDCLRTYHGPHRIPYRIYTDARWPDGDAIGKTTCFIPGKISDHNLLGQDYMDTLNSLPSYKRNALLRGCWQMFEGQYFDRWNPARMVVAREQVQDQFWWTHWVGVDYGFNISQAAAYLFAKEEPSARYPAGRTYVLDEYTAKHEMARDFARSMVRQFHGGGPYQQARSILAWYLSPDAWSQRGDGHTLAHQMMESVDGLMFEPASNDRAGGAMLCYSQLDSGEMAICDNCVSLIKTIESRIHDPADPDKVLKVKGDPLDDCYDAWRYGAYSYVPAPRRSREAIIESAITSSDPTVAMLQRRIAEHSAPHYDEPVSYLQNGWIGRFRN